MSRSDEPPGGLIRIDHDLVVPRMGFGAMRLTGPGVWGDFHDRDEALAVIRRAYDLGVRLFDTADAYGPETNEVLLGQALEGRDDAIIATKGGMTRPGPGLWERDGAPEHLRLACESSLKRLGREQIDLYQLHAPDARVPFDEQVATLADLQGEGKIRQIGLSNVDVDQLRTAQAIVHVVSVQNRYNVVERRWEEVLQICAVQDIVFLPWYPIASGHLARGTEEISAVAERHSATPAQVCLAWLLQHSPATLPIPGTSSMAHLEENVAAADLSLTVDDMAELDALWPSE